MEALTVGALETFAKVAGIAGLGLGVLWAIFRDLIRHKKLFSQLPEAETFKIVRLMLILVFTAFAIAVGAWFGSKLIPDPRPEIPPPTESPQLVVNPYLALIDAGNHKWAWDSMSTMTHQKWKYEDVLQAINTVRTPLGTLKERKLKNISPSQQLQGFPVGAYVLLTYQSDFGQHGKWIENVYVVGEAGRWKVLMHQLAPCTAAPGTCVF
jgi:hypothetical protein